MIVARCLIRLMGRNPGKVEACKTLEIMGLWDDCLSSINPSTFPKANTSLATKPSQKEQKYSSHQFSIAILLSRRVPSLQLTWPLRNGGWKSTFLLGRSIFQGQAASLTEGKLYFSCHWTCIFNG